MHSAIEVSELFCCICRFSEGYTEAQIVAVSGRYDVDSGRSVDRNELRKMQADLNRQKVRVSVLLAGFVYPVKSLTVAY